MLYKTNFPEADSQEGIGSEPANGIRASPLTHVGLGPKVIESVSLLRSLLGLKPIEIASCAHV